MKFKYLVATMILTMTGYAYAGLVQSVPVVVDLTGLTALGSQFTARTSSNDVSAIGCGTRSIDNGMGFTFRFGFCQATDADGVSVICTTQSDALIDEMRANNSYAFITFSWTDDGAGNLTCTRVGFSTQSFYLPKK